MLIIPAVLFWIAYLLYVVQSNRLSKRGLNSLICYYPVERNRTRVFASKHEFVLAQLLGNNSARGSRL